MVVVDRLATRLVQEKPSYLKGSKRFYSHLATATQCNDPWTLSLRNENAILVNGSTTSKKAIERALHHQEAQM